MLPENDLFKIVFDPGSDKREKRITLPGQAPAHSGDTGGVRARFLAKCRGKSPTQPV
ncbi:MAG TPA: hypothetical protein VK819_14810 [Acidobacteriaceae bacterium]|nr:hypothetical protein [Acidobacteriaceae bacterium]